MRHYYHESPEEREQRVRQWTLKHYGIVKTDYSISSMRINKRRHDARRRARKRELPDTLTRQDLGALMKAEYCFYCGTSLNDDNRHLDHFVPISKRGGTTRANMVASCAKCNLSKHSSGPAKILAQGTLW